MTQSAGYPISFFGLFEFPVWLDKDKSLAEFFRSVHGVIWIILAVAVFGHVSAALHHHFIKKNGVVEKDDVWCANLIYKSPLLLEGSVFDCNQKRMLILE